MLTALLLGADHPHLDEPASLTLPGLAIGLTRGRHPKTYPYTDPNEDAVVAAVGESSSLMAVADGHNGVAASHTAIQAIHDALADLMTVPPAVAARNAVSLASATLASETPLSPHAVPATTLTVVAHGPRQVAAHGWGDSVAAWFGDDGVEALLTRRPTFVALGDRAVDRGDPVTRPVHRHDTVLVASDGLCDFLPPPWLASAAKLIGAASDPLAMVNAAIRAAGEGGGGDNVAVAVSRITSSE